MAVPAAALPSGADWSYEVKWDGYRAQIIKNGSGVSLASRNLKTITRQFPSVAAAAERLAADTVLIDGEIVALDPRGRPSFQALHHWSLGGYSLMYYAFDLLNLNGRNLMRLPLDERRGALYEVVADAGSTLLLSEPLPGTAKEIEREVRRLQLEGVVAKRKRSRYEFQISFARSFALHRLEQNRLGGVILQRHDLVFLVGSNLRCHGNLAFALPNRIQMQLDHGERVVNGTRPIRRLPEPDPAIGDEDQTFAAVRQRRPPGIVNVVADALRCADVSHPRHIPENVEQFVGSVVRQRLQQAVALAFGGRAVHNNLDRA